MLEVGKKLCYFPLKEARALHRIKAIAPLFC